MKKENSLVKEVIEDFKARQLARKNFETAWQINMNFLMGNQYCSVGYGGSVEEADKQFFWQEREVFNHIAPIYDIRCAKLAKNKPEFSVVPATDDERDRQACKVSKKILNSVYYKLNMDEKINQAIKWSEVCGTSFYKVSWNASQGQLIATDDENREIRSGEVEVEVCSPFEIFPDDPTHENIEDCQSIIHARAYSVEQIEKLYGVKVDGERMNCYSLNSVAKGLGGLGYNATATKLIESEKDNCALVLERYSRPTVDFPNGRLVIIAGQTLVYDGELPYACGNDGKRDFPFIKQSSIEQTGCFWGGSVIERLVPVQRAYNAVKNRKHEYINRLTLGVLSVEDGSIDLDDLEEEGLAPGKVLVYRQGASEPHYLSGENIPSGFADEEEKLLDEFNKISGVSDKFGSDFARTNISGTSLELMISEDESRLNISAQSIKAASTSIARKILRLYKQFALFPRLARIVGDNGQIELFYFSSNDISSDDVMVDLTGDNAQTMVQKRELIFELLKAGVLSDEEGKVQPTMKVKILDMLGMGNWESAQDISQLHIKKAEKENLKLLDGVNVKVSEIDEHQLHISSHIAFMLGGDYESIKTKNPQLEELFMAHIKAHKRASKMEE